MQQSSDLDLSFDTEVGILSDYLANMDVNKDVEERERERMEAEPDTRIIEDFHRRNVVVEEFDGRRTRSGSYGDRESSPASSARGSIYGERNLDDFPRRSHHQVRLPKFELKKFGGDPVAWPEFFETFRIAIHDNRDLSDVERFTYFKG